MCSCVDIVFTSYLYKCLIKIDFCIKLKIWGCDLHSIKLLDSVIEHIFQSLCTFPKILKFQTFLYSIHFQSLYKIGIQCSVIPFFQLRNYIWHFFLIDIYISNSFHCGSFIDASPVKFSSVTQSCPPLCNPMDWLQHARPPCLSPTPGVYSNSCPLSQWFHPTISSSVIPFFHHQSFPASGSFQMSQLFASGGQSIGVSTSTSVLPVNTQDWSPLG